MELRDYDCGSGYVDLSSEEFQDYAGRVDSL
jgi:hypothetical protein